RGTARKRLLKEGRCVQWLGGYSSVRPPVDAASHYANTTQRAQSRRGKPWRLLRLAMAARPSLASGSDTKLFECRTFQTVEVAFAGSRLLKNMLRDFQRRDRLADHEASIRDDLVQCLPHNGDRRRIEFLFQIIHRSQPKLLGAS